MALIITQRPAITSPIPSNWVAVKNPVLYKFTRKDHDILSASNSGGFMRILVEGDETAYYVAGDTITIVAGESDPGQYYSATVTSAALFGLDTNITTSLAYDADLDTDITGGYVLNNSKRLNYRVEVDILNFDDSTSITNGVKFSYTPDPTGEIKADISSIIKHYLYQTWEEPASASARDTDIHKKLYLQYQELYTGSDTEILYDIENPFHAVLAAMQIYQSERTFEYGSNMLPYVVGSEERNWLTRFQIDSDNQKLRYWSGYPWAVSFIWPDSVETLYRQCIQYNAAGATLENDSDVLSGGAGYVNRLKLPSLNASTKRISLQLISDDPPENAISVADRTGWGNEGLEERPFLIPPYTLKSKRIRWALSATAAAGSVISFEVEIESFNHPGTLKLYLVQTSSDQEYDFGTVTVGTFAAENIVIDEDTDYVELEYTATLPTESAISPNVTIGDFTITFYVGTTSYITNPGFTGALTPWTNTNMDYSELDYDGPVDASPTGQSWSYDTNRATVALNPSAVFANPDFATNLNDWDNVNNPVGLDLGISWVYTSSNGGSARALIGSSATHTKYLRHTIDSPLFLPNGEFKVRITYLATRTAGTTAVARIWLFEDDGMDSTLTQMGSDIPLIMDGTSRQAEITGEAVGLSDQDIRITIHKTSASGSFICDLQYFDLRLERMLASKFLTQDLAVMIPAGDFTVNGSFTTQTDSKGIEGAILKVFMFYEDTIGNTSFLQIGDDVELEASTSVESYEFTVTGTSPGTVGVVDQKLYLCVQCSYGIIQIFLDSVDIFETASLSITGSSSQNGVGYEWLQVSSPTNVSVVFPSPSFTIDFLDTEDGDTISRSISLLPDTDYEYDIRLFTNETTVDLDVTVTYKLSGVTVFTDTANHTAGGIIDINNGFNSGSGVDEIELTIDNNGSAVTVNVVAFDIYYVQDSDGYARELIIDVEEPCENPVYLWWKNSLGGDSFYLFQHNQTYNYTYSNGRKAKRMILYADNIEYVEWEAINELNSAAEVYTPNLQELTTSNRYTSKRIGQEVFIIDGDAQIGVIVIPRNNETDSKSEQHSIQIEIELPELFG